MPALKQGTLVMTSHSRKSKTRQFNRDERKLDTSFKSGAWQPGQKPMVNSSSLNIRDFIEGIAGMGLFLEVLVFAEPLDPLWEFFKDILPS